MSDDLQQSYEKLKRSLAGLGYIRRGSLVQRLVPCGKAGCSCQASPPVLHGPYYQWTRKVDGKTVTVRLSREQADALGDWIAAGRELDRIVGQMEQLSLRATDQLLQQLIPAAQQKAAPRGRRKSTTKG